MGSRRLACFLSSRGAHYLFAFLPGHHTHTHTYLEAQPVCVCVCGVSPPALQNTDPALQMGATLAYPWALNSPQ